MKSSTNARVERITPQVWTPDAKLWVPHRDNEVAFAYPSFGPGTYKGVGQQILEKIPGKDLAVPTGEYTSSLLHTTYCNPSVAEEPEFQEIKKTMRSRWLWVFNKNVFTDKGTYVLSDLEAKGIAQSDISELEAKLTYERESIRFSEDGLIRFAPKDSYKFGEHTPKSLAQDGFVRASYGFDGAEKLSEVAATLSINPITYGVNVEKGNSPVERVSALYENDDTLRVYGFDFGGVDRGHAFGVLESCEAGAKN